MSHKNKVILITYYEHKQIDEKGKDLKQVLTYVCSNDTI